MDQGGTAPVTRGDMRLRRQRAAAFPVREGRVQCYCGGTDALNGVRSRGRLAESNSKYG